MPATKKSPTARLTVTLKDGTAHSFEVVKMPRAWTSWVMQQMPYGTDYFGATFHRERIVADGQA